MIHFFETLRNSKTWVSPRPRRDSFPRLSGNGSERGGPPARSCAHVIQWQAKSESPASESTPSRPRLGPSRPRPSPSRPRPSRRGRNGRGAPPPRAHALVAEGVGHQLGCRARGGGRRRESRATGCASPQASHAMVCPGAAKADRRARQGRTPPRRGRMTGARSPEPHAHATSPPNPPGPASDSISGAVAPALGPRDPAPPRAAAARPARSPRGGVTPASSSRTHPPPPPRFLFPSAGLLGAPFPREKEPFGASCPPCPAPAPPRGGVTPPRRSEPTPPPRRIGHGTPKYPPVRPAASRTSPTAADGRAGGGAKAGAV